MALFLESKDALRTINLRHCRAGLNTLEMCVELLGAMRVGISWIPCSAKGG